MSSALPRAPRLMVGDKATDYALEILRQRINELTAEVERLRAIVEAL